MHRLFQFLILCLAMAAALPAWSQTPPVFATTKVEGTDNVYIFRYMNH